MLTTALRSLPVAAGGAQARGGKRTRTRGGAAVGTDKRLWVGHRAVLCSGVRQTPGHAAVVAGERLPLEAT
jgi:hypothetical protein